MSTTPLEVQHNAPGDAECDRLMVERPRLYIRGHVAGRGYAIQREYQRGDASRFYTTIQRARAVVDRWNRMASRRVAGAAA